MEDSISLPRNFIVLLDSPVDLQQEYWALFAYHKTMAFFYCPLTSSPRINFVLLLHTGQANVCPSYLRSGTASGSYPADWLTFPRKGTLCSWPERSDLLLLFFSPELVGLHFCSGDCPLSSFTFYLWGLFIYDMQTSKQSPVVVGHTS